MPDMADTRQQLVVVQLSHKTVQARNTLFNSPTVYVLETPTFSLVKHAVADTPKESYTNA